MNVEVTTKELTKVFRKSRNLRDRLNPGKNLAGSSVLSDVNIHLTAGDWLSIIGDTGAGKSTLLKLIAGVTEPTEGVVRLRGRLGYLLGAGGGLHPDLTAQENIFFLASLWGYETHRAKKLLPKIIDFGGLAGVLDVPARHLSVGTLVRLAFSTVANLAPEILLLDEVLASTDEAFQRKALNWVSSFRCLGGLVLYVSHDLDEVIKHSTQVLWLDRGKVQAMGAPGPTVKQYRSASITYSDESTRGIDTSPQREGRYPLQFIGTEKES